jgi:hypothetical protein
MSQVLNYDGQYFRVDITEVANPEDPHKTVYVGWCSDAFNELKDMPKQALSHFIAGPPLPTRADALGHVFQWIKIHRNTQLSKRAKQIIPKVGDKANVVYTVRLFAGDGSTGFDFEEFADAKAFAKAAEKSASITRVGITNNESPQYLTLWDKS